MQGGKRHTLIRQEATLSPSMLMEKYNDTEHPIFTEAKWLKAIDRHNSMPYWAWVSSQIDDALDEMYRPRNRNGNTRSNDEAQI